MWRGEGVKSEVICNKVKEEDIRLMNNKTKRVLYVVMRASTGPKPDQDF